MEVGAPRAKQRMVALTLSEDEAKAVHVVLAALALGEAAVRDAWLRHEMPLGRARAALAAAVVSARRCSRWGRRRRT